MRCSADWCVLPSGAQIALTRDPLWGAEVVLLVSTRHGCVSALVIPYESHRLYAALEGKGQNLQWCFKAVNCFSFTGVATHRGTLLPDNTWTLREILFPVRVRNQQRKKRNSSQLCTFSWSSWKNLWILSDDTSSLLPEASQVQYHITSPLLISILFNVKQVKLSRTHHAGAEGER
jgi:hypothetical protein